MSTTTHNACPTCGAALNGDGCDQCASCLFQLAADVGVADRSHASAFTAPDPRKLAPLMPDFEFQNLLGRGGMGVVYRVRQSRLNRVAALKVLPPERASDPAFVERFFREAQALAQLSHPNIVNVYDMGQRGPYLYILMEYIDGENLRDHIRTRRLEPAEALRIMMELCSAVEYAHNRGIVHRDIKPENVLITAGSQVKLLDFGLVKLACHSDISQFTLTEINLRMGTPSYMAPEQTVGGPELDHRVDIYALGVLLYESLTGELPVLDYTPPSRRVSVDSRIDRVVHHAVRESPAERYQRASDMRREIEHIVRTPKRKLIIVGALVLALVLCAVSGFLWHQAATANPAPPPGTPIDGVPIAVVPFNAEQAREHQRRWADHLGVPVRWTNSIGMEFVLIPPGEFTRGIREDELPANYGRINEPDFDPVSKAAIESGLPRHRVRLTQPFYLCTTETTQEQYEMVAGEKVGYFRAGMPGERVLDTLETSAFPAENLSYSMAVKFCDRLSELDGFSDSSAAYRLPTDAEWGFALRAGSAMTYWYGSEPDTEGIFEITGVNSGGQTHPVASKRANPFGLYDMGGNVAEYCIDWWSPTEYQRYADRAAVDPSGPKDGIAGGLQRIVRGGHFSVSPRASTRRTGHKPHQWINWVGFRAAIPAEAVARNLKVAQGESSIAAP